MIAKRTTGRRPLLPEHKFNAGVAQHIKQGA
jgi:hypothetical protein